MIKIDSFTFNAFQENTYLLSDDTKECILVDPGCYDRSEKEEIDNFIIDNNLSLKAIYNTHCHVDHILGNYYLKEKYKVKLIIHKKDYEILKSVKAYAPVYGFQNYQEAEPDEYISENDIIKFGNSELKIFFVPGHAPGHIAFYNLEQRICVSGDVLFNRSIGRTDFPGCSFEALIDSIHTKLFSLPDDTIVFPGHGPTTTIGEEKKFNPFCGVNSKFNQ